MQKPYVALALGVMWLSLAACSAEKESEDACIGCAVRPGTAGSSAIGLGAGNGDAADHGIVIGNAGTGFAGQLAAAGRSASAGSFAAGSGGSLAAGANGAAGFAAAGGNGLSRAAADGGVSAAVGTAGSGGGATGSAGAGGSVATDGCGSGGWTGKASNAGPQASRSSGDIEFQFSSKNSVIDMKVTMAVPPKPKPTGTVFLWPGLQPLPNGKNYNPIGNGVLQPVLTWGGTCAPNAPSNSYADWWISAQYVNVYGAIDASHMGCLGGQGMTVQVSDLLDINMTLKDTTWTQTVVDEMSKNAVDFSLDMKGQAQLWAIFSIELPTSTKPAGDLVFTRLEITLAMPEPEACQPITHGPNDFFSTPAASVDGTRCCIDRMALRAAGVPATTMD